MPTLLLDLLFYKVKPDEIALLVGPPRAKSTPCKYHPLAKLLTYIAITFEPIVQYQNWKNLSKFQLLSFNGVSMGALPGSL